MEFIGIQGQIRRNNAYSLVQLCLFPLLLLGVFWVIFLFATDKAESSHLLYTVTPAVLGVTAIWFLIAWGFHSTMIRWATGAKPLERTENKRVYNLVENLCISCGMPMPKLYIIHDDSLNAFASGIDKRSYAVTLSRGMINKLDDAELEGVIAHELSHIRNRDVRLLIVSIIFVGIFAFLSEMTFRMLARAPRRSSKDKDGAGAILLVAVAVTAIAYFLSILLRFGISRKREYMADAGAAELTKNPQALASALRKISADPYIEAVERRDVAQLFIEHPKPSHLKASWDNLFATHPPIDKRIALLEQFT